MNNSWMDSRASVPMAAGIPAPVPPTAVAPVLVQRPSPAGQDGSPAPVLLSVRGLKKSYRKGRIEVPVLRDVEFEVAAGEFTAIVGQSGSGKSTLLHLLGTLDAPDAGEIWYQGQRIDNLRPRDRDRFRRREIGLIFQFYHLLPELSTLENVLIPRMIDVGPIAWWLHGQGHRRRGRQLLERVSLGHRLSHKPRELSGGELQRAAIARALIAKPRLLLADEPTGNLDSQNSREVLQSLLELRRHENLTIVMVTHDDSIAALADRVIRLVEGRVECEDPAAGSPACRHLSPGAGRRHSA